MYSKKIYKVDKILALGALENIRTIFSSRVDLVDVELEGNDEYGYVSVISVKSILVNRATLPWTVDGVPVVIKLVADKNVKNSNNLSHKRDI